MTITAAFINAYYSMDAMCIVGVWQKERYGVLILMTITAAFINAYDAICIVGGVPVEIDISYSVRRVVTRVSKMRNVCPASVSLGHKEDSRHLSTCNDERR
jgi:hypothetical protein